MNSREIEQIKSYSRLIVYELHQVIFEDAVFDKLKATLALAEELEFYIFDLERKKNEAPSNVVQLRRIA